MSAERVGRRRARRMAGADREEIILRAASAYFAEQGLGASTVELARRIGIAQPLLYKYFPTKDALIERIYDRLLTRNWNPNWEAYLDDDSIPVRERLTRFYTDYSEAVLTYEHVRLFLFSGLSRPTFNTRYYDALTKRILRRIARAIRREYGGSGRPNAVTRREMELVQSLHGAIYHIAFRRWVHGDRFGGSMSTLVGLKVDAFLDGAVHLFSGRGRGARP